MTPPNLAAWKQVCEAATPGEWTLSTKHKSILLNKDGKQFAIIKHMLLQDRKFIATFSPAVVLRLLEVVERQREDLEKYGQHVHQLNEPGCYNLGKCVCGLEDALAQDAPP